jgi:flagellar motor switch protein FliG
MSDRKGVVITTYGHNRTIDKIAVSLFEDAETGYRNQASDAKNYCDTINALELSGDSWVFAKILSENSQYALDVFIPLRFSDVILKFDNLTIQRILRDIDNSDLARSLKDQNDMVKEKIFINMSKRAAQMLAEDIEFMGPVKISDVKETQEKILNIIRRLANSGEIVIPYEGETVT